MFEASLTDAIATALQQHLRERFSLPTTTPNNSQSADGSPELFVEWFSSAYPLQNQQVTYETLRYRVAIKAGGATEAALRSLVPNAKEGLVRELQKLKRTGLTVEWAGGTERQVLMGLRVAEAVGDRKINQQQGGDAAVGVFIEWDDGGRIDRWAKRVDGR